MMQRYKKLQFERGEWRQKLLAASPVAPELSSGWPRMPHTRGPVCPEETLFFYLLTHRKDEDLLSGRG